MLTEEQKSANREKYIGLLGMIGLDTKEFIGFLDSIDYFEAPLTAQYNGSYAGGLCEYALKLAHELGVLCEAYFPDRYSADDILKVALLKEAYRAVIYEPYAKNVKDDETGKWTSTTAYRTRERRPVFGDLGFSSYMTLKDFAEFSDEQIEAIIHTTGSNTYSVDLHEVQREYPLVVLTKMADLAVNNF